MLHTLCFEGSGDIYSDAVYICKESFEVSGMRLGEGCHSRFISIFSSERRRQGSGRLQVTQNNPLQNFASNSRY
jgi:hypothetical protein